MVETGVNKGRKYSVWLRGAQQVENLLGKGGAVMLSRGRLCVVTWAEPGRSTGVWVSDQPSSG